MSSKQGTEMLLYRGSGNGGEGCRPECPPDPATTLRWNPTSEIVTPGRASGMIDDVRLRPSSSRPWGLVGQGRGQDEVVSPTVVGGFGCRTVTTQPSSTVVDFQSTSFHGGSSINSRDRGQRVSLQDSLRVAASGIDDQGGQKQESATGAQRSDDPPSNPAGISIGRRPDRPDIRAADVTSGARWEADVTISHIKT